MPKARSVKLARGSLPGYRISDLARDRRRILGGLIVDGVATYAKVIQQLNVLGIYKFPDKTQTVRKDIAYIQRHYSDYARKSPKRAKSPKRKSPKRAKSSKRKSPKRAPSSKRKSPSPKRPKHKSSKRKGSPKRKQKSMYGGSKDEDTYDGQEIGDEEIDDNTVVNVHVGKEYYFLSQINKFSDNEFFQKVILEDLGKSSYTTQREVFTEMKRVALSMDKPLKSLCTSRLIFFMYDYKQNKLLSQVRGKACQARFEMIGLSIWYRNDKITPTEYFKDPTLASGHANIVLIDHHSKTIERFEPGYEDDIEEYSETHKAINRYFTSRKRMTEWGLRDYTYVTHPTICPVGPQHTDYRQYNSVHVASCLVWSFFYVWKRVTNLDVSPADLFKYEDKEDLHYEFLEFAAALHHAPIHPIVTEDIQSYGIMTPYDGKRRASKRLIEKAEKKQPRKKTKCLYKARCYG